MKALVAAVGPIDNDGKGKSFDTGFMNIGVRPSSDDVGNAGFDPFGANPAVNSLSETITALNGAPCSPLSCIANGSFKIPMLRNVALTAPYFHAGTKLTLAQVVDFYNRGGDFANPEKASRIKPLSLDAGDQADLVEFLTNGLTDCRVEKERAPFDHPSLSPPNGATLPAVGAAGLGACP